jgi:hypothetical protein
MSVALSHVDDTGNQICVQHKIQFDPSSLWIISLAQMMPITIEIESVFNTRSYKFNFLFRNHEYRLAVRMSITLWNKSIVFETQVVDILHKFTATKKTEKSKTKQKKQTNLERVLWTHFWCTNWILSETSNQGRLFNVKLACHMLV